MTLTQEIQYYRSKKITNPNIAPEAPTAGALQNQ